MSYIQVAVELPASPPGSFRRRLLLLLLCALLRLLWQTASGAPVGLEVRPRGRPLQLAAEHLLRLHGHGIAVLVVGFEVGPFFLAFALRFNHSVGGGPVFRLLPPR